MGENKFEINTVTVSLIRYEQLYNAEIAINEKLLEAEKLREENYNYDHAFLLEEIKRINLENKNLKSENKRLSIFIFFLSLILIISLLIIIM